MNLSYLITSARLRRSTRESEERDLAQEVGSDRGRVVFSEPFRRLQKKAQVFSLEENAAIRSRLTHSLEVAHVGSFISEKVIAKNDSESTEKVEGLRQVKSVFSTQVEIGCLLHDIGNPPFGHLGESAISDWFKSNAKDLYVASMKNAGYEESAAQNRFNNESVYSKDFLYFDGNPQGFRVVAKLKGEPAKKGLNLTCSQLAAFTKYPEYPHQGNSRPKLFKKYGCFVTEKADLDGVWKELGLGEGVRHPLVYLVEAADDIAYSLSDLEDGIEKGVISERRTLEEFYGRIQNSSVGEPILSIFRSVFEEGKDDTILNKFISLRTQLIVHMAEAAADRFIELQSAIESGSAGSLLDKEDTDEGVLLKEIKKFVTDYVYKSADAEDIEIAGYNVIQGILNSFAPLMTMSRDHFRQLAEGYKVEGYSIEKRLIKKLPSKYLRHYLDDAKSLNVSDEWFVRLHILTDYVCGMTDDFALKIFQLFRGIRVEAS